MPGAAMLSQVHFVEDIDPAVHDSSSPPLCVTISFAEIIREFRVASTCSPTIQGVRKKLPGLWLPSGISSAMIVQMVICKK
jgi:hypothetical protein